jgi:hypothetical protein
MHCSRPPLLPLLLPLLLLPLLPLLPLPLLSDAPATALLALVAKAIYRSPHTVEFACGLDQFALDAALCWHLHVDEGLLAAATVCPGALLAAACQPIRTVPFAIEAVRCQDVAASLASLLLGRVLFSAAVASTPQVRTARQAGALPAAPVLGLLRKPSGRQQLVALLAGLVLLCWRMPPIAQPACTTTALAGIDTNHLGHSRLHGFRRTATRTHSARQDTINWDTDRCQDMARTHHTPGTAQPATGNMF